MSSWSGNSFANRKLLEIGRRYDSVSEFRASDGSVRHKCFLSYYSEDADEVLEFVEKFKEVFIPKIVGISEDDSWINSDDDEYVMDTIRENYLTNSTVTLVLVGKCTWARKFVDWEVYSSLRRDPKNRLNGLLAIELPSVAGSPTLPERVRKNVIRDKENTDTGYARFISYPTSESSLRDYIEDAFMARSSREHLIELGGQRRKNNSSCP